MNQMPSPRLEECSQEYLLLRAAHQFEMRRRDVQEAIFQDREEE